MTCIFGWFNADKKLCIYFKSIKNIDKVKVDQTVIIMMDSA